MATHRAPASGVERIRNYISAVGQLARRNVVKTGDDILVRGVRRIVPISFRCDRMGPQFSYPNICSMTCVRQILCR